MSYDGMNPTFFSEDELKKEIVTLKAENARLKGAIELLQLSRNTIKERAEKAEAALAQIKIDNAERELADEQTIRNLEAKLKELKN